MPWQELCLLMDPCFEISLMHLDQLIILTLVGLPCRDDLVSTNEPSLLANGH